MVGFLKVVRSVALLLARVGLGGVLILHGWRRYHTLGIDSQVAYLRTFATPFAEYAAWGGTAVELVGGLFLILGALTPLVAAAVVAEQVLIIAYTSWYRGWSLTDVHGTQVTWAGGWEYNVIIGLLALLLVTHGSGVIGIDQLFHRRRKDDADQTADDSNGTGGTGGTDGTGGNGEPQPRQRLGNWTEPGETTTSESTSDTLVRTP